MELLAVVWSNEHFRKYVYGTKFQVILNKGLTSVLKWVRGDRTYSKRLKRWVDCLLPFQFNIVHATGRTLELVDYLSRHSSPIHDKVIKADKLWTSSFRVNHVNTIQSIWENEICRHIKCKRSDRMCATACSPRTNQQWNQSRSHHPIIPAQTNCLLIAVNLLALLNKFVISTYANLRLIRILCLNLLPIQISASIKWLLILKLTMNSSGSSPS